MRISNLFTKMISCSIGMLLLFAPLTVLAQTKVVVIPLFGDDTKPLKNIITVAKANGNFTDPVAAVNSISDASAANPYLVVIGPGVYTITQTLYMKQFVDIVGSGENVTKLTGAISTASKDASSTVISGANNSALSSLTVENTGGNTNSIAMWNYNASPTVSYVTLTASGGGYNYGVYSVSYSSPTMSNVSITASGGTDSCGVYNWNHSYPAIRRSTIEGGYYSLSSALSAPSLSQSTLIGPVSGGSDNKCVACDNGSGTALNEHCLAP